MYFDDESKKWDTDVRKERAKVLADLMIKKIDKDGELIALEVGCGTGLISFGVKDKFKEIYCVDTSKEMLNVLKEKMKISNASNIYPYEDDLITNKEFFNKFDVIYSSMVFHHIIDIKDEIEKLYRLLKEDGYLIIIDLDEDDGSFHLNEKGFCGHNGFKRSFIKSVLEEASFKEVSFDTVYKGKKKIKDIEVQYSLFLCLAKI